MAFEKNHTVGPPADVGSPTGVGSAVGVVLGLALVRRLLSRLRPRNKTRVNDSRFYWEMIVKLIRPIWTRRRK